MKIWLIEKLKENKGDGRRMRFDSKFALIYWPAGLFCLTFLIGLMAGGVSNLAGAVGLAFIVSVIGGVGGILGLLIVRFIRGLL